MGGWGLNWRRSRVKGKPPEFNLFYIECLLWVLGSFFNLNSLLNLKFGFAY